MRALGELNADTLGAREVARAERAILDAARAYVVAMRRWNGIPTRELSTQEFKVAWDAANRAWAALDAAVDAAAEANDDPT